jgi:hypothetical protein
MLFRNKKQLQICWEICFKKSCFSSGKNQNEAKPKNIFRTKNRSPAKGIKREKAELLNA